MSNELSRAIADLESDLESAKNSADKLDRAFNGSNRMRNLKRNLENAERQLERLKRDLSRR